MRGLRLAATFAGPMLVAVPARAEDPPATLRLRWTAPVGCPSIGEVRMAKPYEADEGNADGTVLEARRASNMRAYAADAALKVGVRLWLTAPKQTRCPGR